MPCSAATCSTGLASSSTRSACLPFSTVPSVPSRPRNSAAWRVTVCRTRSGDSPARASSSNSWCSEWPGTSQTAPPEAPPAVSLTPALAGAGAAWGGLGVGGTPAELAPRRPPLGHGLVVHEAEVRVVAELGRVAQLAGPLPDQGRAVPGPVGHELRGQLLGPDLVKGVDGPAQRMHVERAGPEHRVDDDLPDDRPHHLVSER